MGDVAFGNKNHRVICLARRWLPGGIYVGYFRLGIIAHRVVGHDFQPREECGEL